MYTVRLDVNDLIVEERLDEKIRVFRDSASGAFGSMIEHSNHIALDDECVSLRHPCLLRNNVQGSLDFMKFLKNIVVCKSPNTSQF